MCDAKRLRQQERQSTSLFSKNNNNNNFARAGHFLYISLPLLLQREASKLDCCLCSCSRFLFFFFSFFYLLSLIFTLLATSISHFLTPATKFSCFSSNEIRLLCFSSVAVALCSSFVAYFLVFSVFFYFPNL